MKWQANGELADNDLHVLISHLQQMETEERSSELCRLSRQTSKLGTAFGNVAGR